MSDWLLSSRCQSLLHTDRELAGSAIHVDCKSGTVMLRGSVTTVALRERAERIARGVQGVEGVRNELVILATPHKWSAPSPVVLSAPSTSAVSNPHDGLRNPHAIPAVKPLESTNIAERQVAVPSVALVAKSNSALPVIPGQPKRDITAGEQWRALPASLAPLLLSTRGPDAVLKSREGLPSVVTYEVGGMKTVESARVSAMMAPWPFLDGTGRGESLPQTESEKSTIPSPATSSRNAAKPVLPVDLAALASADGILPVGRTVIPPPPGAQIGMEAQPPIPPTNDSPAAPTRLGSSQGVIADVQRALASDPRARQLRFEMNDGELVLSGQIASPSDLYELAARLSDLPGIEGVRFDRATLRIAN